MYEVPKIEVPVEINLANNESLHGRMFISDDLISPAGNPEIDQFLNEDHDLFFSFQSDAGAYRLINKEHVTYIRTQQSDEEIRSQTPLQPRSMVVHFTSRHTIFGVVYPTLAEETRVSDILNQDDNFITVYQNGEKLIINRNLIVYVNAN